MGREWGEMRIRRKGSVAGVLTARGVSLDKARGEAGSCRPLQALLRVMFFSTE